MAELAVSSSVTSLLGVELPFAQQIARDRIGRAAERPDGDGLALEIARPVACRPAPALGRAEIDVAAIDAIDHGAQLGALELGESVVLGAADEGEGWPDSTALVWPPPVSMVTIFTVTRSSKKPLAIAI